MKRKNKPSLNKRDFEPIEMPRSGSISGAIIISVISVFAIVLLIVLLVSFDVYLFTLPLTIVWFAIILLCLYTLFGLLIYFGKSTKKHGNMYMTIVKSKQKYKILREFSTFTQNVESKEFENSETNDETQTIKKEESSSPIVDNEAIKKEDNVIQESDSLVFVETKIEKQDSTNINLVSTFKEFGDAINEFFYKKGYKSHVGVELVASLATSPILFMNDGDLNDIFIDNINACFNSPNLIVDAEKSETIENDYALFDSINTARSFKNSPVFLVIKNLKAENASNFLLPLKKYFINRNTGTIKLSNNIVNIPNNLYVIVSLKEKQSIYKVDSELLKYSSVFNFDCVKDEEIESSIPLAIELGDFNIVYSLNRLKNDEYLDEEHWKKIDAIEESLVYAGHPGFDNKTLAHLESYSSIVINASESQDIALDETLANLILIPALTRCNKDNFVDDGDIQVIFNGLFEEDEMPKSRNVLKDFFQKSNEEDKEGNL